MRLPGWRRRLYRQADEDFKRGLLDRAVRHTGRDPSIRGEPGVGRWVNACWRIAYDAGWDCAHAADSGGGDAIALEHLPLEIPAAVWAAVLAERMRP